ncbi:ATP-binding cassette domain-containing protein [Irregularibacter muris]|uniref:ATP-binding cassette domain-containing protein n=1 Tax=Irregularibacter muris TaxID=1796619 RepID=A0AAE3L440_9FIRM|nr:ATP-binding cassette domain-containing protein [Irregularibacter muris]MCR1899388.1 ATP-binding cassette domain-containing protein [Irregularibacter muris]
MLFEGKNISFSYPKGEDILRNMNISIESGERVGLIAKSGYGKSTLAKILAGYVKPTKGEVFIDGKPIPTKGHHPVQLIYQHPEKAINPRWRMKEVLEEGGVFQDKMLQAMGIEKHWLTRYPRELSSGELQRFSIVRALGGNTKFLIADEITTMLDAINQAQIWKSILEVVEERNLGLLVITHNHHLANKICTRKIYLEEVNG